MTRELKFNNKSDLARKKCKVRQGKRFNYNRMKLSKMTLLLKSSATKNEILKKSSKKIRAYS